MSRWCLAVSHGLPRGWFLVWRCVLHGRVSSFFRASESSVRQFFCGAVLAGLGSFKSNQIEQGIKKPRHQKQI